MEERIDFAKIEKKWQEKWEKAKLFEASEDSKKKKFYVLEMFPYPSATGLHMGHAFNFTIGDVFARFKKMQGFNVMHPMGFDSLGLPAENSAIKVKQHPEEYTNNSIKNFIKQQNKLGITYDWTRVLNTADPEYYRWDQWIFLKMFEKGLVYQKEAPVNWCNECNTILANEQVQGGKCWRHEDTEVEIKQMNQWYLKITDYADRLLEGHKKLNWPEKTIAMQKNWIGKSYGTEIDFEINGKIWPVFTTRPDTIFGVTFMVVSAQHKNLMDLATKEQKPEVEKFLKKLTSVSEKELADMEKEGVFTGSYAINPATGEKVPVYAGNFVVADYGAGMVMAVPAHDQRDFEFAKKYNITIKEVIIPNLGNSDLKAVKGMLEMIKEVYSEFEKKKVKIWFNGTFGVIGHYKKVFTTPRDIDCGVLEGDFENSKKILVNLGYKKMTDKDNGQFRVSIFEKNGVILEIGTFSKDLGNEKTNISGIEYRIPDGKWLAECYRITSKKDRRAEMNDAERAFYLEIISNSLKEAYTGDGELINSKEFNGISNEEAKNKISDWLISKKLARKTVNYKLRDWSVARQRYWGTPIPLIHCEKCGIVPVPEKELPVKLPKEVKFGAGNPLLTNEKWLNVKCPKCSGKARREANTMDTFVNSSWYFLRYCDPHNDKEIFSEGKVKHWMPIDLYIGGAEHACMHLIYCRFYTMFLHDLGLIDFGEPAPRLFHQGMINGTDGEKMSKSKGNGVEPLETIAKYGVDATRFFLLSEASPDKGFNWSDSGIQGSVRIINKIWKIAQEVKFGKDSEEISANLNKTIKNVSEQIENLDYRKSTIELRALFDSILKNGEVSKDSFEKALKLLSPFCPHIAEELWEKIGNKGFISTAEWPRYDGVKKSAKKEDINNKIIENIKQTVEKIISNQKVNKIYLYVMPFEINQIDKNKIEKVFGKETQIFAVNDPEKYDPENRSKKAVPGKPGVFAE